MVLTEFTAHTKAQASQVNANFKGITLHEVYNGSDFNTSVSASGSNVSDEQSYEMSAISASDLGSADYLIISINVNHIASSNDGIVYNQLKIQTKDIGGSYSDSVGYTTIKGSVYIDYGSYTNFKWIHTLTNDEKTNGVQVKIFGYTYTTLIGVGDSATGSITNVQTTIQSIPSN